MCWPFLQNNELKKKKLLEYKKIEKENNDSAEKVTKMSSLQDDEEMEMVEGV